MYKQRPLFEKCSSNTEHGGASREGKRKVARPLATKKAMHLVLCSSRAREGWSFLRSKNYAAIELILKDLARRYGIRVMGFENVGNHLHLLVQGKSRPLLKAFLRDLPAKIAKAVTGAKKGNQVGRFFDQIIFTRVVEWGRDLARLRNYFVKNRLEANGVNAKIIESWRSFLATAPK